MRSVQERVVRKIRTLRAMRWGLETAHGSDIEALPTETGSNKLGRAYGAMAPVLDPTILEEDQAADRTIQNLSDSSICRIEI